MTDRHLFRRISDKPLTRGVFDPSETCCGQLRISNFMYSGSVVLADSHLPMLEGVRSLLEGRFEIVVMVADESSLLHTLEKLRPGLAVVDMSFPRIDPNSGNIVGLLRERFPELLLVLLSVHDEPLVAQRMLELGAAAYVLKRSAATDFLPAIDKVLGGGRFVSPAVKPLSGGAIN
jgi:DNA-binding NarL/FixJ family response regulator